MELFIRTQLTGFRLQHNGNAIPDGIGETTGAAHQLLLVAIILQGRPGNWADENTEQLFIHLNIHKAISTESQPELTSQLKRAGSLKETGDQLYGQTRA